MTEIINPFPYLPEAGTGGYIYIGTANMDARTNPVVVYRDEGLTLPWAQPIRTVDGYPAYQGAKSGIYASANTVSLTVMDSNQRVVTNDLSAAGPLSAATLAASGGSSLVGFIQAGTGAVARTAQSKMRDVVSVFDFMTGAQINDVQANTKLVDVTAAIQAAIDYCNTATNTPELILPAGTYKITDSLFFGSKTQADRRTTFFVRGSGIRVYPVTRGDNTNTTAGTMIDATAIVNRPAIVVQGCVGSRFSDFTVLGSGYQQNYDLSLSTRPSTVASWVPTGHTSGQYNASCGIGIDPYSGTAPGTPYSTGIAYGRVQSSNVDFTNVASYGWTVGVGVSINSQGFLGDSLRFNNCRIGANAYNFAICGTQNRDVQYNDCVLSGCHTVWDNKTFGAQGGDIGHIKGGLVGSCYRIFNIKIEYNASSCDSLYSETINRIGNVDLINTAMAPGMTFTNCYFKEESDTAYNAKDPQFFPVGGGFVARSCAFFPHTPWATLYGISGSASTIVPPRFESCSFVSYINTGAPSPRPFKRWYVGEFKNLSAPRPQFVNCRFDMWEGDAAIAGDFLDSSRSCGETLRWNSTTLPVRQEVVNYSAVTLLDRDGKLYNLKNVSSYALTNENVTNKSWTANVFTFDTATPTAYAPGDMLFYGDSSLPLFITNIAGNTITSVAQFGEAYYDTTAGFYNAAGFRIAIVNAQFVNNGAITGDISSGTNTITNVTLATTAFKVGDFIGSASPGIAANTRITGISGTTLTLNKNATATTAGIVIGNLICVAAV